MSLWKWGVGAAAVPVAAFAAVYAIGLALPRDHSARAEATLTAPPAKVAATIWQVEDQPSWRSDVQSIEVLERRADRLRYIERSGGDAITFELVEERPGERFRSRIADPSLPFGGSWTIALSPDGSGTRVTIEERGTVSNPVYRFFAAIVFGHEATMKTYLADLERALVSSPRGKIRQ
jgi:uncharacterized protein YndB with AHSA1/START domain